MSYWYRFHLNETVKTTATSEPQRFLVQMREPAAEQPKAIEFYRWTLTEAQDTADDVVQEYFPHNCEMIICGNWTKDHAQ